MLLAARLLGSLPGSLEQAGEPAHCWKPSWLQTCPPQGPLQATFTSEDTRQRWFTAAEWTRRQKDERGGENQTRNWIGRNLEFRGHICEGGRWSTLTKGSCKMSNFLVYPQDRWRVIAVMSDEAEIAEWSDDAAHFQPSLLQRDSSNLSFPSRCIGRKAHWQAGRAAGS